MNPLQHLGHTHWSMECQRDANFIATVVSTRVLRFFRFERAAGSNFYFASNENILSRRVRRLCSKVRRGEFLSRFSENATDSKFVYDDYIYCLWLIADIIAPPFTTHAVHF